MVIIKFLTGQEAGNSIEVSSQKPDEVLKPLLSKNIEWEVDYSRATEVEEEEWLAADLTYRINRAFFQRKLPVIFFDNTYHSLEELRKSMRMELHLRKFFNSKFKLALIRDDEEGIEIGDFIPESKRKIYEECIKNRSDFREKGLDEHDLVRFVQDALNQKILENFNSDINELLDYAAQARLKFKRPF